MLQRLYVHNYRCLENFELILKGLTSSLVIGKNGTGKSTISHVLEIFQSISRGTNRVRELVGEKDIAQARSDIPIRFEIEISLEKELYKYVLVLELPENSRELRVFEEQFLVSGKPIYSRKEAKITLYASSSEHEVQFFTNRHFIALPLIQEQSTTDPIRIFRTWLTHMIILTPIPNLITGNSKGETLEPVRDGSNFGDWISGLLSRYPAAYTQIDRYLREVLPDFQDFLNQPIGRDSKSMIVRFEANHANLSIDFKDLSDGEKYFFLCATVLAANKSYGPLFCFWDEPDKYLSLSEIGHFVISLRCAFQDQSQIIVTTNNPEAIRRLSNENTFVLDRKSHLEPTLIRLLSDLSVTGDIIDALTRDEIGL